MELQINSNTKSMCEDKVLITYGWNRISYIVNRSLATKGVKTYIGDMSNRTMNSFSRFTARHFVYPNFYIAPLTFVEYIIRYALVHEIPYLIPVHEESLIIAKYKKLFDDSGISFLMPSFENMKKAHKKNISQKIAKSLSIPTPETIMPCDKMDISNFFHTFEKPIVLKYINTNSAKGVFYIYSEKDIESHLCNIGKFILQEYVKGIGYGVSLLYNKESKLRGIFSHKRLIEKLHTGGTSTLRIGIVNAELEEYAKKILESLAWQGVAMVEFKHNPQTNKSWFIEINPRFWGSLALAYLSGVDFPYMVYQILHCGDCESTLHYRTDLKVEWKLGSYIAFLSDIIKQKKINLSHFLQSPDGFDDWWKDDKTVFIGELLYYFEKFFRTLQLNPTKETQIDVDLL